MLENFNQILDKGGIIMMPLLLCSLLGLAIVIDRAFHLRRGRVVKREIAAAIDSIDEPSNIDRAMAVCKEHPGPFASVIRAGLQNRSLDRGELKEVILDQGRREVRTLERGLGILETIAAIAPLLGLLGTVLGMIKVFTVISEVGTGQAQALSGGISEALITTAVGLGIGIPALVAFNFFSNRAHDFVLDIERHSAALLQKLLSPQQAATTHDAG